MTRSCRAGPCLRAGRPARGGGSAPATPRWPWLSATRWVPPPGSRCGRRSTPARPWPRSTTCCARWICRRAGSGRTRRSPGCTGAAAACSCSATVSPRPSGVALTAAAWTGGLADPTVGGALISLGYDRDFAAIDPGGGTLLPRRPRRRDGRRCGSTARCCACPPGCCSTWAPRPRAWVPTAPPAPSMAATGNTGGVLVSLGGDIATGGTPPRGRLADPVADDPACQPAPARSRPSGSGWPAGRWRPRRSPAASGGGPAGCCTTSWIPGPGCPRTARGGR